MTQMQQSPATTASKNVTLSLKACPTEYICTGADGWLVIGGAGSAYRVFSPPGVPDGCVAVQEVASTKYWTIRHRGPVGDLHGVELADKEGTDGTSFADYQLFRFESQAGGGYLIKESTKDEYVSKGHNGVIVRWAKGNGNFDTQKWVKTTVS